MRIAKKEGTVVLNGSSPEFVGTVFAGHDFEIEVKHINRVEKARIRRNFAKKGKENITEDDTKFAIFQDVIVGWKGFENEKGQALKCDEKGKRYIFDNCPELTDIIIVVATASNIKTDEEQVEGEAKN